MMKLALAIAVVAACNADSSKPALVDLSTSLDAARTEFNAHAHEARFLTLLSPT
jgi:hypothetical protein